MKAREVKRGKLVERYAEKRAALKAAGDSVGLQKLQESQETTETPASKATQAYSSDYLNWVAKSLEGKF